MFKHLLVNVNRWLVNKVNWSSGWRNDVNRAFKKSRTDCSVISLLNEHEENEDFIRRSGARVGLHPTNFPGKFVNFCVYKFIVICDP